MGKHGKNINMFLMDGEVDGRIKVSISNWNCVAWKLPRVMLENCKDIVELNHSGIYFLFGPNQVYVGQADVRSSGEGIGKRIADHFADRLKDSWDEVVILTREANTLGLTDISFLENYFYERVTKAGRYEVLNNLTPRPGTVTIEKKCELEEYAESAEMIIGMLGYRVFEKVQHRSPDRNRGILPELPSSSMKIGDFVSTAMKNLSDAGFDFSQDEINAMCTIEWSKRVFHLTYPFMRQYEEGKRNHIWQDGYQRFWAKPYTFGSIQMLVSSQWFDKQYDDFKKWYKSLAE